MPQNELPKKKKTLPASLTAGTAEKDVFERLYNACMKVRGNLEASSDVSKNPFDDYRLPRAERLRREADRIEAQDAAILEFRRSLRSAHVALGKSDEGYDWGI